MTDSPRNSSGLIQKRIFFTTAALLAFFMLAAGLATYFVPGGRYVQVPGQAERIFETVIRPPLPAWKIVLAPLLSLTGSNGSRILFLVIFILTIGGGFSVMNRSGVLPRLASDLAHRLAHRKTLFLIVNIVLFSLLGSCLGILEEIVPMVLIFVPLALGMGWDRMTGLAIPFLSAGFGFAAAMFNPFTVGTAQKLAGLPLFSGLSLRVPLFLLTTALATGYLLYYTRRLDKRNTGQTALVKNDAPPPASLSAYARPSTGMDGAKARRAGLFIALCFIPIVLIVLGGAFFNPLQELAFPLIALIFLIMGLGAGLVSGAGAGASGRFFIRGLADFAPAIILVLQAASVGYLMEEGLIMDPILNFAAGHISGLAPPAAALSLYFFQMLINLFVPSGTGQAVLTIPILAPLGDLVGVTRQTVVLAYQCGDGFSNLIWPTNPMLHIAVGLAGVSYKDWVRWVLPLQGALLILCSVFTALAAAIGY